MYAQEFDALWQSQARFHPAVLTDELRHAVHDAIFYQRPLRFDPDVIGDCDLEPGEKRCPKAHWLGQQFRMLQEINLLEVFDPEQHAARRLTGQERQTLAEALAPRKKMTFDQIRQLLRMLDNQVFNLEQRNKRAALYGNPVEALLQSRALSAWYNALPEPQKAAVHDALATVQDPDVLGETARAEWGLSDKQVEKLLKTSLPSGHFRVSLKAIRKLMPHLEAGCMYSEAKERAGYALVKSVEVSDRLPPVQEALANLTNPLVGRALTELRKVVNSLVAEHGPPERIVVELTRDLKNSRRRREQIAYENRQRDKENRQIRTRLVEEFDLPSPSRDDVIRYRLWEECGQTCPYTGRTIPAGKLFGPDVDVEHILPYSRSLDNSYMNKTLCYADENRRQKHNRTPYEAYGHDEERYEAIIQRVARLPWGKRRKFLQKNLELDECVNRQLSDTRYISRVAVEYLRALGCKVACSKGGVTASLRRQWGLDDLVDPLTPGVKTRDDHRHHAVDAAVVAMATPSVLQRLARSRFEPSGEELPPPWDGFRAALKDAVEAINVSFRPSRKVSGALHQKTGLGPTAKPDTYVYRVPVAELTPAMVERGVRDDVIRDIIRQRCRDCGVELSGSAKLGKVLTEPPLQMPSGVPIKRVRIESTSRTATPIRRNDEGEPDRYVLPGEYHHVEIFADGEGRWTGTAVSRMEATRRAKCREPLVSRSDGAGSELVMWLCINDMVRLTHPDTGERWLCRVQAASVDPDTSRPDFCCRVHTSARGDDKEGQVRFRSWKRLQDAGLEKVTVDPIGRVFPCND